MEEKIVKLSQVKVNDNNPRTITEDKFGKLITSILVLPKMLEIRPVVVDKTMVALGGNMRLRALQEIAKMSLQDIIDRIEQADLTDKTEAEMQILYNYWNDWLASPVVKVVDASDLSEAEQREFIVKDNVGFGQWDWDKIANEWEDLPLDDWGLDKIPDWEAEDNENGAQGEKGAAEEDDYDVDAEVEPRSHFGEIWQCGRHHIICGDSTKAEHIQTLFAGKNADLYLTDPPYNVAYEGGTEDRMTIANDNMSDEKFFQFLSDAFKGAADNMKPGAAFYIWHADSEGLNFRKAVKEAGLSLKETLIWNKNAMVMGRQDYQWKHEPCLYGWKGGGSHHWYSDRKQTTVIDFNKPIRNDIHPTMKPVGLFGYLMQNSTQENDIVFDGFLGSGTSLIAAEQLGRICYGVEYDPKYFDRILTRWETLTGGVAQLIGNINEEVTEKA